MKAIFILLEWNLVLYGNEPVEMYDSFMIKWRGLGDADPSDIVEHCIEDFWSDVIVYSAPLYGKQFTGAELANWRMRSSGG